MYCMRKREEREGVLSTAGKQISSEQLSEAVKAYCAAYGQQSSQSEEKPNKITIFSGTPEPGDPMLWLEDGLFRCSDSEFGLNFAENFLSAPEKALAPAPKRIVPAAAKPTNGPKNGLAVRDVQVQDLTFDDIKTYICEDATDQEAMIFLKLCQARNLNPFLRDAYLIKYDKTKPAQMVVGKDAFTKKAEDHPKFAGYKAGIIVDTGAELEHREGTFIMKGETLLGGWAEVYRSDRAATPYKMSVPLNEYSTGKSNWVAKPATMIRKVALVQALREAFPSDFSGMYDQAEMGIDPAREVSA